MSRINLSIVIPVYNSELWIIPTIEHIVTSLEKSHFNAEIVVVDDGSSDGSSERVESMTMPKSIKLALIKQENTGRYLARKRGVEAAMYDNILFVDSRVYVDSGSLLFLSQQLSSDADQLWNGHVNIDKKGNVFARFWDAIVCIAWRKYFRRPKTTQYGSKDFDYYPKGTGFFYVPKKRLLAAMAYFEKETNDLRFASDDTLLIRYMIERQDIHLSPSFSCLYHGRSTLKTFMFHAYNRGQFFIDGFLRPGNRFFYPLIGILTLSVALLVSVILWPVFILTWMLLGLVSFVTGLFFGALILGVGIYDSVALALLGGPFAVVYLAGLWRGVARKITSTARKTKV